MSVKGTWSLEPYSLNFGDILLEGRNGEPARQAVEFDSSSDSLLGVDVAVPWLECRTAKAGARGARILVTLIPEHLPPGVNHTAIKVRTDNVFKPTGVIFVRARAIRELTPLPEHLFLIGTKPGRVRFTALGGEISRISQVESSNDSVRARILESDEIEVASPSGEATLSSVRLRVVDAAGRSGMCLVSVFE